MKNRSLKHSKETFLHERNKRNLDLKYLRVMEIGILVSTFVQQMIEFLISKIMELLKKYLRNV